MNLFNPDDFIDGSEKLDGSRKFGYGIDTMRAWCAYKDTDKNIYVMRDQLEKVNKEVKLFRDVLRVLVNACFTVNTTASSPSSDTTSLQ